jgi:protein TonB
MLVRLAASQPRITAAAAIALAHALVIYAIATWSPQMERSLTTPLRVQFISTAESKPQPPPPRVDIVMPHVAATLPQLAITEIPVAEPSDRAITVAVSPAPAPPVVSNAASKLISQVEYVQQPVPRYPPQSRRLREQGLVVLRVEIDELGTAANIQIESSSGYTRLDAAAREAVSRALFRPYVEDGAPRRALVLIPIEFSLARASA